MYYKIVILFLKKESKKELANHDIVNLWINLLGFMQIKILKYTIRFSFLNSQQGNNW